MTTTTLTPDAAVRDFVLQCEDGMTVDELRSRIENVLTEHPGVSALSFRPRGKKGAGVFDVRGHVSTRFPDGEKVAVVTIKANGEVDATPTTPHDGEIHDETPAGVDADDTSETSSPAAPPRRRRRRRVEVDTSDAPDGSPSPAAEGQAAEASEGKGTDWETTATIGDVLVDAGVGAQSVRNVLISVGVDGTTTATAEQHARAGDRDSVKGLRGAALGTFIVTGERLSDQQKAASTSRRATASARKGAAASRRSSSNADASPGDQRAAELATEIAASKGAKLSQRVTPKETATTRRVLLEIAAEARGAKKFPNMPDDHALAFGGTAALLGFKSDRAFRSFVTGETATKDLNDDAKTGVKDLTKRIASHQVWARKAAAAAAGVAAQTRENTTAGA